VEADKVEEAAVAAVSFDLFPPQLFNGKPKATAQADWTMKACCSKKRSSSSRVRRDAPCRNSTHASFGALQRTLRLLKCEVQLWESGLLVREGENFFD